MKYYIRPSFTGSGFLMVEDEKGQTIALFKTQKMAEAFISYLESTK